MRPPRRLLAFLSARVRGVAPALARIARRERLWIVLALCALGVIVCAFAAIHIILASNLLRRWVNTSPEDLLVSYDSASSWVPGILRVRGLTMRGSDENVQWIFRMEDATITISLVDLIRKRFHATHVRARGLVFLLRQKEKKGELSAAHLARLPAIPGFSDPPLKTEAREPPPPPGEARRHFWSVLVEDLIADPTDEIWMEIYRFRGRARVTGGFYLHPHLEAWVGPAAVAFLSGDITLAPGQSLLARASGRADCVIEPHDPEQVRGDEIWRKISGNIRLAGRLEDLQFLNHFLRHSPEPRLEGGGGTTRVDLRFVHGIGQGRADFEVAHVGALYGKETVRGRASGRLEIPRWDVEHDEMEISGSRVDLADITTAGTRRDERDWWGRFKIVSGRLGAGLVARTAVHCRDARPLYTLLNADLPGWAQGILRLEGLSASARVRLSKALLEVRDLAASGGKFRIAGEYSEKETTRRGAFLVETGPLAVGVAIEGSGTRVRLLGARSWFERARATAGAAAGAGS